MNLLLFIVGAVLGYVIRDRYPRREAEEGPEDAESWRAPVNKYDELHEMDYAPEEIVY